MKRQRLMVERLEDRCVLSDLGTAISVFPPYYNGWAPPIVNPAPPVPVFAATDVGPGTMSPNGRLEFTHPTFKWQPSEGAFLYKAYLYENNVLVNQTFTIQTSWSVVVQPGVAATIKVQSVGYAGSSDFSSMTYLAPGPFIADPPPPPPVPVIPVIPDPLPVHHPVVHHPVVPPPPPHHRGQFVVGEPEHHVAKPSEDSPKVHVHLYHDELQGLSLPVKAKKAFGD